MPHVSGQRVLLREYQMEDLPYARLWVNDPETTAMLSHRFLPAQSWEDTEAYFRSVVEDRNPGYHFVIAQKEDGAYLGQIDLFSLQQVDRHAELGIVIGEAKHRGKGYGREAIGLLLGYAFDHCNLNRVHLTALADNLQGIRCYEACGFVREGVLRQHSYMNGAYRDLVQMGVLREDWRKRG